MSVRTAILAVILSAGLLSADEKKADWVTYSSADHKCEIMFPSKPKEMGDKDSAQALLEAMGGNAVYLLQINKFPGAIAIDNEAVVNKVMDGGRDALVKTFKSEKPTEKSLTIDKKYPARDIDLIVPALGIYRVRFVVTPTHFYQVTMAGPKEFVDSADSKKFLESFKVK